MSIDYGAIADSAHAALLDAGGPVVLSVPVLGAYNPATGTVAITPVEHQATGVVLPPGAMTGSGFKFSPDVIVQAQALIYLSPNVAVTPCPGATVTVPSGPNAGAWKVIASDTLAPAGVPVLHAVAVVR